MKKMTLVTAKQVNLPARISFLLKGFLNNELSQKELDELDLWILESDDHLSRFEAIIHQAESLNDAGWNESSDLPAAPGRKWSIRSMLTIAAILGGLVVLFWLTAQYVDRSKPAVGIIASLPGMDEAMLVKEPTLLAPGFPAVALRNIQVNRTDFPFLQVNETDQTLVVLSTAPAMEYMVLIPPGRQWKLQLPDGSRIRINADTRLRFPAAIHQMQRKLVLSGEAFFEVAASHERPFDVYAKGVTVMATGTAFNVNTHAPDGKVSTALVKGEVLLHSPRHQILLKPGMAAMSDSAGHAVVSYDSSQVMSWLNRKFVFKDTPLDAAMDQIRHWYGVEVEYLDPVRFHLNGTFDFSTPLPELLRLMEKLEHARFDWSNDTVYIRKAIATER